jgi:N6-adenosine-specific RNA methylase IME4
MPQVFEDIQIDAEFAALIPPLSAEERQQLEENIVEHGGARDPLVVWASKGTLTLLDGHNRYEICTRLGLPFDVHEVQFNNRESARIWIRANQAGRRNLPAAWRIELELGNKEDRLALGKAKKTAEGKKTGRGNKKVVSQDDTTFSEPHSSRKETAKAANTSVGQVAMAEQVREKRPDLWEQCKQQEVGISTAYKQIRKDEKKAERASAIESQRQAIATGKVQLPPGVFEVVVMDPPWAYGREYDPDGSRVANPYPEMNQEQLQEMQPPFASDCVLFLWTTHQFIWDAGELLRHWGFTYKATLVWDKDRIGMGAWLRMQCEFCLIGTKGKPTWNNTKHRDIVREARREHSRKPEAFYEIVEDITVGRRLDFFSRQQRPGWETFGNDREKF